jgi:hypothetical protein
MSVGSCNTLVQQADESIGEATAVEDYLDTALPLRGAVMPYRRGLCAQSSRLRDNATPENRITIEATDLFTKPWQTVVTYKRQPDALFQDNVCLDSLDLEHWLPASTQ